MKFREGKNLNAYREMLKKKNYNTLGTVAFEFGIAVSTLYNLFSGHWNSEDIHRKIAKHLNIEWSLYYLDLKTIYKDGELDW